MALDEAPQTRCDPTLAFPAFPFERKLSLQCCIELSDQLDETLQLRKVYR
jgi:hypothetical protein